MLKTISNKIKSWREEYLLREKYTHGGREPFYDLAKEYLPKDPDSIIVDIGAGNGGFANYLGLIGHNKLYLLDGNKDAVKNLKRSFGNVIEYRAPAVLPFKDKTVKFIHSSHLIEHLYHEELHALLKELDRVLMPGGILMISTPLLWKRFYNDMSHVKPYYPKVITGYLCKKKEQGSSEQISEDYKVEKLVYRYRLFFDDSWGSSIFIIDIIMKIWRRVLFRIGIRQYTRNGYTIIFKKK